MDKLKGLDFYEALRIVDGTDRRMRYKEVEWFVFDPDKQSPNISARKEKVWEVEPEIKLKRCPFCGAKAKPWRHNSIECSECETFGPEPIKDTEVEAVRLWNQRAASRAIYQAYNPSLTAKANERAEFETEVEEEKPKEITVWGACDVDGESYIYNKYPRQLENKNWESQGPEKDFMALAANNLFPKDKPQELQLVPVNDK